MLSSFLLHSLFLAFTLLCFIFIIINNNNVNKLGLFKYLVIAFTINILLKSPMHLFCEKLELMSIYYIWCGLVGCLVLFIISTLRNNTDYNNVWHFVKKFLSIVFILTLYSYMLHIGVLLYICIFIPDYWQLILSEFWKEHREIFISYVTTPISPADPMDQLNRIGYNRNGTNQPIATNIADALKNEYDTNGSGMSAKLLPSNIKRFLVDYLLENDRPTYDKLMGGVNLYKNENPKWWNISNTKDLRNGLRALP